MIISGNLLNGVAVIFSEELAPYPLHCQLASPSTLNPAALVYRITEALLMKH